MTFADTALAVIEMARRGEFTGISDKFLPQLRPLAPPEALRAAWDAEVAKNGQVSALGTPLTEAAGPGTVLVKVPVTFERATATLAVGLAGEEGEAGEEGAGDQGPWITGIQLLPASAAAPVAPWEPPPYADPDAFTEHDVTVGDGPLAVRGTLSVPAAPARHRSPAWSCWPARGRMTRTRRSGGTSRSRTSPGDWPPRASPCCGSRR
jgi:hypothetical protein